MYPPSRALFASPTACVHEQVPTAYGLLSPQGVFLCVRGISQAPFNGLMPGGVTRVGQGGGGTSPGLRQWENCVLSTLQNMALSVAVPCTVYQGVGGDSTVSRV